MKPKIVIERRLDEIHAELERALKNPYVSDKHLNRLVDEGEELRDQLKTHAKAVSMSNFASPAEQGFAGRDPGDDNGIG